MSIRIDEQIENKRRLECKIAQKTPSTLRLKGLLSGIRRRFFCSFPGGGRRLFIELFRIFIAVPVNCLDSVQPKLHSRRQRIFTEIYEKKRFAQIPCKSQFIPAVCGSEIIVREKRDHIPACINMRGNIFIPFGTGIDSFIKPYSVAPFLKAPDNFKDLYDLYMTRRIKTKKELAKRCKCSMPILYRFIRELEEKQKKEK